MSDLVRKWITALRSGDYNQGIGYLCRDGCLGAACDVLEVPYVEEDGVRFYENNECTLPDKVRDMLGLRDNGRDGESLYLLNDYGISFADIADRLENGDYFEL